MFQKLQEKFSAYLEYKLAGVKMEMKEEIAKMLPGVIISLLQIVMATLFLMFAFLGLGLYLNVVLESEYWGFFIVSGFFLICVVLAMAASKSKALKRSLREAMERKLIKETEDDG